MALKFRRKVLLAKKEVTYGVDPTPVGATDAMLAQNLVITPQVAQEVKRNLERNYLGNEPSILVGLHVDLTFDVEIAGAGAAGTAPAYAPLLKACGWAETINAGVSAVYNPVSSNEDSATLYYNMDGQQHRIVGARGSVSLTFDPKGVPHYSFKLSGLYVDPAAVANPVPTLTGFKAPIPVSKTNTPTFSLQGFAANMALLTLDRANVVNYRNIVGTESVQISDRAPAGQVTIEEPALGTKDFFAIAKNATLGALQLIHGIVAGAIVQIDAPSVQCLNPSRKDDQGISMLDMKLLLLPVSGDDELVITVK